MALSPDQLSGLLRLLSAAEAGAALPGITVTRCDAEDMRGELPYRRSGGYDLFLVDTASHCWRIVDDLQAAGGIVLAAHA